MSKFQVSDRVQMPGVPFVVEVLEVGTCEEATDGPDGCEFGSEIVRFKDPGGLGDDWEHASNFELVNEIARDVPGVSCDSP